MAKTEERKKVLEREYIINIRSEIAKVPRYRKTEKAVTAIREFLLRHMKVYDKGKDRVKISKWLNEYLWKRGIKNPPIRIKIKAVKFSDNIVEVDLAELPKRAQIESAKEKARKEEAEKIEAEREAEAKKAEEAAKATGSEQANGEQKEEQKEQAEKLKEEERLLEKDLEKQAHQKQKAVIKPQKAKEVYKKHLTGV